MGFYRTAWELVWGLQMGAQLPVGQQDVCLLLELPFCSRDGSLQSSKPELIPAGVFKKSIWGISLPLCPGFTVSTLWVPGDKNIWPVCLCICIVGPVLLTPGFL